MNDNRDPRGGRPDNDDWDRWNSSAANSSYYNQPVREPWGRGFSRASFLLGAVSVVLGFTMLSLPLGALGIFFAMLVSRKGKKLNSTAKSGLALSCIGAVFGLCAVIVFCLALPDMLRRTRERAPGAAGTAFGTDVGLCEDLFNRCHDCYTNPYYIAAEEQEDCL